MIPGTRYCVTVKRDRGPSITYTAKYIGEAPSPVGNEWSHVFGPVEESGAMAVYVAEDRLESAEEPVEP